MKHRLFLAGSTALVAAFLSASTAAANGPAKSAAVTCPASQPEAESPPVDLSKSGLIFDPAAPGGARPAESSGSGAYPSIAPMQEALPQGANPPIITTAPTTGGTLENDPSCRS